MIYLFNRLLNNSLGLLFSEKQTLKKLDKLLTKTPTPSILFVCIGNICRSPYGECYLKSIDKHNTLVTSAGLRTHNGLSADPSANEEAKKRGLDLGAHKTSVLTKELIEMHDLILFMEPRHILKAAVNFNTKYINKYLLLGLLADPPFTTQTIDDPYGRSAEVFEATFKTIESACDKLNNLIKR